MSDGHRFGGDWTDEKLARLSKYLHAYMTIFRKNVRAATLKTIYVDAFAGTGYRNFSQLDEVSASLFQDKDVLSFHKGSVYIALESSPPFDQYLFIEQHIDYFTQLEKLRCQFHEKSDRIKMVQKEANQFIQSWCAQTNWKTTRSVVFLDPYGMEVDWQTVEAIARTEAIDLWILFPLGQAVNRMLTRNQPPKDAWAKRLTRFFGTGEWKEAFYQPSKQRGLFDSDPKLTKEADFDAIKRFFIRRLETVFYKVAQNPLPLRNSKNVPIFLLCFAASNPKGAPTAVNIAQDILGDKKWR